MIRVNHRLLRRLRPFEHMFERHAVSARRVTPSASARGAQRHTNARAGHPSLGTAQAKHPELEFLARAPHQRCRRNRATPSRAAQQRHTRRRIRREPRVRTPAASRANIALVSAAPSRRTRQPGHLAASPAPAPTSPARRGRWPHTTAQCLQRPRCGRQPRA